MQNFRLLLKITYVSLTITQLSFLNHDVSKAATPSNSEVSAMERYLGAENRWPTSTSWNGDVSTARKRFQGCSGTMSSGPDLTSSRQKRSW